MIRVEVHSVVKGGVMKASGSIAYQILAMLVLIGVAPVGSAEPITETEPNNSCANAQNLGYFDLPRAIDGSLTSAAGDQRVDFYKVHLRRAAGHVVRAWLLSDWASDEYSLTAPNFGFFVDNCTTPAASVNGSQLSKIRLEFTVPPGGEFILGVSGAGDAQFSGNGASAGNYRIALVYAPGSGTSISGIVVDSITGEPICINEKYGAWVALESVGDGPSAEVRAACDGSFLIEIYDNGAPLRAGTYKIFSSVGDYNPTRVEPFELADGQHLNLGEIALVPPRLRFENLVPCSDLSTDAQECVFTVDLVSYRNREQLIEPWVMVEAYMSPAFGESRFDLEPLGESVAVLPPLGSLTFRFSSPLPNFAAGLKYFQVHYIAWAAIAGTNRYGTVSRNGLFGVRKNQKGEYVITPQ